MENQFALVSDIHGNRLALEAVLDDIDRQGITKIFDCGDTVYGPLDPSGTADHLIQRSILSVCGNEDRILIEPVPDNPSHYFKYNLDCLNDDHLQWIENLPKVRQVDEYILIFHGTPQDDLAYCLEEVTEHGIENRQIDELSDLFKNYPHPLIFCGHSHQTGSVILPDGKLIVNPGSVGLQAYSDDVPCFHKMEMGTPHARYAVLTQEEKGWRIQHVAVPYDWESASQMAKQNGRPDWAQWLLTGQA